MDTDGGGWTVCRCIIMKRKFIQWWSSFSQTSTKWTTTSFIISLHTWKYRSWFGTGTQMWWVEPVNGITTVLSWYKRIYISNLVRTTRLWNNLHHVRSNIVYNCYISFPFLDSCISAITDETFAGIDYKSNTLSALKETKTVYQSRAHGFTPGFLWVCVADLFSFLCCVFLLNTLMETLYKYLSKSWSISFLW